MFSMVKAFVPRYRYDQLMRLGWKVFLPISIFMVVAVAGVLEATGWGAPLLRDALSLARFLGGELRWRSGWTKPRARCS